jgi:N-acetylglutamate synthase
MESVDGWLLGHSGADTRRANSTAPESAGHGSVDDRIGVVEKFYARRGRASVFKMTSAAEPKDLDDILEARGYERASETIVMTVELSRVPKVEEMDSIATVTEGRYEPDWFAASAAFSSVPEPRWNDYRAILDGIIETSDGALFGRVQ